MHGRTTLGVTAGALVLATAIAIPALDMTVPAARDLAAWIEVDDPPAATLALPAVAEEGRVVLEPRAAPAPVLRTPLARTGLAAALTAVPEAPPEVAEPEAPLLADVGPTDPLVLPALDTVLPRPPGGGNVCCAPASPGVVC